ncbi:transposase [Rickettsia rhipicephali]|uniref:transposase n=1 Tax=Rickettsia rhipicephali TaxID=33992 RepID=UPI0018D25FB0|nr:transposase [Rickettsia rhipicephali]
MIPNDHLLVRIHEAKELEFSFIYEITKNRYCANYGRPSIDPVLFFRMQIISYLYGIKSNRRLCKEIQLNIAYRWFCGLSLEDKVPDHSSLSMIRDRFGVELFQEIFISLIKQWYELDIIKGETIISDASLVESNASMNSLILRKDQGDSQKRELKKYERRYHDFREGKKVRKISNQTHVSRTDPDCSLVSRTNGDKKLCYKTHYSIDSDSRIIIDCYVSTGSQHECIVLPSRVWNILNNFSFRVKEWIADKGYGRGPTYGYFKLLGITTYIPLHVDNLGEGKISRGEFQYDREQDRYKCPQGHYLYPYDKLDKKQIKRYRITGGHCKNCSLKSGCISDNYSNRGRFIYRNPYQDEIDEVKVRQNRIDFKKKLIERKWKIEGLFGEAKENHGLRGAKFRSVQKTQIQILMIAIVQNFKRILKIIFWFFYLLLLKIKNIKVFATLLIFSTARRFNLTSTIT